MIVIPAIDLRGGRCVRLRKGDPNAETIYDADPVEQAQRFESQGARRLHVVDLDAALGTGSNLDVVEAICRAVAIRVQLGGGLRSLATVDAALELGIARVVLGSAALTDAGFVEKVVAEHGEKVVVAADVLGDRVMVHGWQEAGRPMADVIPELAQAGAPRLLITSIDVDGTLVGPDVDLYRRVLELTDLPVIASGGVRDAADVRRLFDLGVEGVVIGKALYEGTLSLSEVARG